MPSSTDQLHTFAMDAEHSLEQLATGIATVGADDATIKGITQMAHACRQIATKLAQGGAAPPHDPNAPTATPASQDPQSVQDAIAAHMAVRRGQQPPA